MQVLYNTSFETEILLSDDEKMLKIIEFLKLYHLSLHEEEITTWDNPEMFEKTVLNELRRAVSYFTIDGFKDGKNYFDYNQVSLSFGYQINMKQKTAKVYFKYQNSNPHPFIFNLWQTKKQKIIETLNGKIKSLFNEVEYLENNWESPSLVMNLGVKYQKKLKDNLPKIITINDEKIPLNFYRINFYSWKVNKLLLNNYLILKYQYLWIGQIVDFEIALKSKPKINQIVDFLSKQNLLSLNFDGVLDWKLPQKILEMAQKHLEKLKLVWIIINKLFHFQSSEWDWKVNKISKIGPFDNKVVIYFQLNDYQQLVPITLNFKPSFKNDDLINLQQYFNNKFFKIKFLKKIIVNFSDTMIMSTIKSHLDKQIFLNNQLIPFDSNLLGITNKTISENALNCEIRLSKIDFIFKISLTLI